MEFYLSFNELLGRGGNSLAIIFLPLFLVMTMLEGLIILYRQGSASMSSIAARTASAFSGPRTGPSQ